MNKTVALLLLLVSSLALADEPAIKQPAMNPAAALTPAAAQGPKEVVQAIFAQAAASDIATDKSKQDGVNAMVDFDTLSKDALGRNLKSVPASEQAWFRDTLKEIISLTVYPKAPGFLQGVKINYDKVDEKGNKATVASTVQNKADLTDVSYKMGKTGDTWKVTDVAISGLSWVESIRDQVNTTIKTKKWKGLKELMNKRLANLKAGKV